MTLEKPAPQPFPPRPRNSAEPVERRNRNQDELRRTLRSTRRSLTIVGLLALASFGASLYLLFRPAVTAHGFVLLDDRGRVRARLGMNDYFPELVFFDAAGEKRGAFDIAGVYLRGEFGTTMLRELDHVSILEFKRGETRTRLVNQGDSMFLKFLDYEEPSAVVDLTLDPGGKARIYANSPGKAFFIAPVAGADTAPRTTGPLGTEETSGAEDPSRDD